VEITEVRIKLMEEPGERLKAFCSITFDDCFVIRDLKIIDGTSGPFVAMPSRKLTSHCSQCGMKNHLRANYCNQCGKRQDDGRLIKDADGRAKLYADIAHPINSFCREMIQARVIEEFFEEIERAKLPGYMSRYDDFDGDYVEAPRERTTRTDTPHDRTATSRPHHPPQSQPATTRAPTPPMRPAISPGSDGQSTATSRSRPKGFGAGIFPEDG
jgi:stage V sporulation protein G